MLQRKNEYLQYLKSSKKLSANTMTAYSKDLADYLSYLSAQKLTLAKIRKKTIYAYENKLAVSGKSTAAIARAMSSIRGFHGYLQLMGYVSFNPTNGIETPKIQRVTPGILSLSEVELLLSQPKCTSYKGYRDRAILELLYATGIRVSELVALKYADLDIRKGTISCTDRIIPFGSFSSGAITEYIAASPFHSGKDPDVYLFTNTGGKQLTRQGVWKTIRKYKLSAGIEKDVSPQILRNSFASHLIENGADVKIVQELMGHTALSSTLIYAEASKNRLRDAYDKAHPRAKNTKTE